MKRGEPRHRGQGHTLLQERAELNTDFPLPRHAAGITPLPETSSSSSEARSPRRIRQLGSTVLATITPVWDRAEWATVGTVVVVYAGLLGGAYVWEQSKQIDDGGGSEFTHYYVHAKASPHGDTLVSLLERYGHRHNPWTEHHAQQIAARLVQNLAAVTELNGQYEDYILSVDEELTPGEKIQMPRNMLEKPVPYGAVSPSPATP